MNLLYEKRRAQGHHPQVAAAMIGSAVIGGAVSSDASRHAANTQKDAANAATATQKEMFDTTVKNNAPYNQAGQAATRRLSDLLGTSSDTGGFDGAAYLQANPDVAADPYFSQHPEEHYQQFGINEGRQAPQLAAPVHSAEFGSLTKPFSMSDFQMDPGIQFQTQQGNQALMNSQAAKNGVLSGGALKDLIAYNQGMAGTGYQSAYDRYMGNKQLTLSSLMGVAGLGQNAAANTGNNSATVSNGIAGTITGAGNAQAAGMIGSANALSGAAQGVGNSYFLSSLLKNPNADMGGPITTSANPGGIYSAAPQ